MVGICITRDILINPFWPYCSIAGTHTTSATATLLFYNLLHNPDILQNCVQEIDDKLPPLEADKAAYSVTEAENSLPYLRACVRENFRLTPVFSMPLERRVTDPEGILVAGRHIKQGVRFPPFFPTFHPPPPKKKTQNHAPSVSSLHVDIVIFQMSIAVCNHAFHHNPRVWGDEHNIFDPSRWDVRETADRARYLMHFGLGSRQCLGKTVAQTNIYKLTSTLLHEFDFQIADPAERDEAASGGFRGRLPEMISVGVSDLKGPLMVTAKVRKGDEK